MYCTSEELLEMLNPDMVNHIIGEGYISDPQERRQKLLALAAPFVEDACAEVDGYLAKRYPVPLPIPPKVIVKYTKDIAVYNLISRMGVNSGEREDNYRERYKAALKFLTMAAEGKVALGIGAELPDRQAQSGFRLEGSPRRFSRGSMKGM